MSEERLALVQRTHDLFARGISVETMRIHLAGAPDEEIIEWFRARGVSDLIGQVASERNRRTVAPSTRVVPPVVNAEGLTKPSKAKRAQREAEAVAWAKTATYYKRYWWDAMDDIDFLLGGVERDRAKAQGWNAKAEIVEALIVDLKSGMPKEDAAKKLRASLFARGVAS